MPNITFGDLDKVVSRLNNHNKSAQNVIVELSKEFELDNCDKNDLSKKIKSFLRKRESLRKLSSEKRQNAIENCYGDILIIIPEKE